MNSDILENLHCCPQFMNAHYSHLKCGKYRFTTDNYEIFMPYNDNGVSDYSGKTVRSKNNALLLISPNVYHEDIIGEGFSEGYLIKFASEEDIVGEDVCQIDLKRNTKIRALFDRFRSEYDAMRPGYRLRCQAIFCEILDALREHLSARYTQSKDYRLILPAVDKIHSSYTDCSLTVTELAGFCGISEQYLGRLFRRVFGRSPYEYLTELRMNQAAELLKSGEYSVSDTAIASGFGDISHFSRNFKKRYGVTPSDWAKKRG